MLLLVAFYVYERHPRTNRPEEKRLPALLSRWREERLTAVAQRVQEKQNVQKQLVK